MMLIDLVLDNIFHAPFLHFSIHSSIKSEVKRSSNDFLHYKILADGLPVLKYSFSLNNVPYLNFAVKFFLEYEDKKKSKKWEKPYEHVQ